MEFLQQRGFAEKGRRAAGVQLGPVGSHVGVRVSPQQCWSWAQSHSQVTVGTARLPQPPQPCVCLGVLALVWSPELLMKSAFTQLEPHPLLQALSPEPLWLLAAEPARCECCQGRGDSRHCIETSLARHISIP